MNINIKHIQITKNNLVFFNDVMIVIRHGHIYPTDSSLVVFNSITKNKKEFKFAKQIPNENYLIYKSKDNSSTRLIIIYNTISTFKIGLKLSGYHNMKFSKYFQL